MNGKLDQVLMKMKKLSLWGSLNNESTSNSHPDSVVSSLISNYQQPGLTSLQFRNNHLLNNLFLGNCKFESGSAAIRSNDEKSLLRRKLRQWEFNFHNFAIEKA